MPDFSLLRLPESLLAQRSFGAAAPDNTLAGIGKGLSSIAGSITGAKDRKRAEEKEKVAEEQRQRQIEIKRRMSEAVQSGDVEGFTNAFSEIDPVKAQEFRDSSRFQALKEEQAQQTLDKGRGPQSAKIKEFQEFQQLDPESQEQFQQFNKPTGGISLDVGPEGEISFQQGAGVGGDTLGKQRSKGEELLNRRRLAEKAGDTERVKIIDAALQAQSGVSGDAAKLSGIVGSAQIGIKDLDSFIDNVEDPNKKLAFESVRIPFTDIRPGRALSQDTQVQVLGAVKDNLSDQIGRLRSGGAINEGEEKRFLRLLPAIGDTQQTMKFKSRQLAREFNIVDSRIKGVDVDPELLKQSDVFKQQPQQGFTEEQFNTKMQDVLNRGAPPEAVEQLRQKFLNRSPSKVKPQSKAPGPVGRVINSAGSSVGVDSDLLTKIAKAESGLKPGAKNPKSSAGGLFQFIDGTWKGMVKKYGKETGIKMGDKFDPQANATMGALFTRDNINTLSKSLGRKPNNREVYLAHFLGAGGAIKMIKKLEENPNASARKVVPANVRKANASLFRGRDPSIQDFFNRLTNKVQ